MLPNSLPGLLRTFDATRVALDILKSAGIGWALWDFRGDFGILDSGRDDVDYKDWHAHALDERLLKLLQAN